MTSFPSAPRVLKGAIVALDLLVPLPRAILFQYNPARMTRSVAPQYAAEGGAQSDAMRLSGPPQEDISITVEIDATDQLAAGDRLAAGVGIYPQLAALELLLYPKSRIVVANAILANTGVVEVMPPEAPLTLFVWGVRRVLPVRLTSLSVDEQLYDAALNPIRASVSLGMRVLTYNDLPQRSIGYGLSIAQQLMKEGLAGAAAASLAATGISRIV